MARYTDNELLKIVKSFQELNDRRNERAIKELTEALAGGHAHSSLYEHVITAQAELTGPWSVLLKRLARHPEATVNQELATLVEEGTRTVLRWSLSTSTSDVHRLMDRAQLAAWQDFLYETVKLVD